jgi:AraC family transcriptional regulator, regulatory protein of adaptative response / DNA-3-methyladenine glycosylase II
MKNGADAASSKPDPDACYLALQTHDARFDGSFFTGVTSTGIYCRPVCRVKTPKLENCRFFHLAAQAEQAGFRPCLRCRPELAPQSLRWSVHDASSVLAQQAAQLLEAPTLSTSCDSLPPEGAAAPAVWQSQSRGPGSSKNSLVGPTAWPLASTIEQVATRMGISARHLRRIFEAQFGVSPLQYLQTRRLLTAKQLLTDTQLAVTEVALASGFASVRRFNAAFAAHYRLNPTQLRREDPGQAMRTAPGITVRLGYRPPYDVPAMLAFYVRHAIGGVDWVAGEGVDTRITCTFGAESGGVLHTGWLRFGFDEPGSQLLLEVSDSLCKVLPLVIGRVRALFDLDADPQAINAVLHARFPQGDGLRVPGALDGFDLAVRAVLGQQITVAAARTLAERLVGRFGEPIDTPWPRLNRLFPTPAALAASTSDGLGTLGIVRQRQAAIIALAQAVQSGQLQLHAGVDVAATVALLKTLPGIGDWTAQYIAMRALRWPDAFPAGDVALHKALGVQTAKHPAREAEILSHAWKPWRSYAVLCAWGAGAAVASPPSTGSAAPAGRHEPADDHDLPTPRAGRVRAAARVATGPKSL